MTAARLNPGELLDETGMRLPRLARVFSETPVTVGVRVSPAAMQGWAWTADDIESGDDGASRIRSNLRLIYRKGCTLLVLPVCDAEQVYYEDGYLERRYDLRRDPCLPALVAAAKRQGMSVFIDLSPLAALLDESRRAEASPRGEALDVPEFAAMGTRGLKATGADGIYVSGLEPEYLRALGPACRGVGKLLASADDDPWMSADLVGLAEQPDVAATVGAPAAGQAALGGRATWLLLSPERLRTAPNLPILCRVANGTATVVLELGDEPAIAAFVGADVHGLLGRLQHVGPMFPDRVANVVVALPWDTRVRARSRRDAAGVVPALTSALRLSGYRVALSYRYPLPDAAFYIVVWSGHPRWRSGQLPPECERLLTGTVPVVYAGTGFGLPQSNTERVAEYFSLTEASARTVAPTTDRMIPVARYGEQFLPWHPQAPPAALRTALLPVAAAGSPVETLVSGRAGGDSVALLLRRDRHYLLNANALDLHMGPFLAFLFERRILPSFRGVGVVDHGCCLLATGECEFQVRGLVGHGAPARFLRLSDTGRVLEDGRRTFPGVIEGSLRAGMLLLAGGDR